MKRNKTLRIAAIALWILGLIVMLGSFYAAIWVGTDLEGEFLGTAFVTMFIMIPGTLGLVTLLDPL